MRGWKRFVKFAFMINSWIICGMSCSAWVVLYRVRCSVLVTVSIHVPNSRTWLQFCGLRLHWKSDLHVFDCGDQIYCCVILELDYFKFLWAVTVEACEMKHEIRGLSVWQFIELQSKDHFVWPVLCSPHWGVNVLWYCPKCSLFWSRDVMQECFETPLAFLLHLGLYLFCYIICLEQTNVLMLCKLFSLGGWHWWWYSDQSHGFKKWNWSAGC